MKAENYLNIVEKLNSELEESEYFLGEGIGFNYTSTGYVDSICFIDHVVFDSEMDESYSSEEHIENIIRERMKKFTKALCRWQHIKTK